MKIGIITYHFPYNCGAALQCLALQTKLEELGHQVEIINYRPWYHQNRYTPLKNPIYWAGKCFHDPTKHGIGRWLNALDGFLRTVRSWRTYPTVAAKERKFRSFHRRFLHQTRVYRTLAQLRRRPPKCDVYISGSDQVWNCALTGGSFDQAYFLKFGGDQVRRVTYSVGTNFSGLDDPAGALEELVKDLDRISLRETRWRPAVEQATGGRIPVHIDVDPTLLLRGEDYGPFKAPLPQEPEPYILTYTMTGQTQKQIYDGARLLSKKLGMKVLDVSGDPNKTNRLVKDNRLCGPDEFLHYVQNASYVLTNSFHGTVFSILYGRPFFTIPHAQTGNRVTELLEKLGLSDRWNADTDQAVEHMTDPIDYDAAWQRLGDLRQESAAFLADSVAAWDNGGKN